jgi:hypothetical protein
MKMEAKQRTSFLLRIGILFDVFRIPALEFINTSCGINKFHFSGIERMRCVGDLKLYQWVFKTIFPDDGFLGMNGRFGEKCILVRHILEDNQSVILRMNIFLHFNKGFILSVQK